MNNTLAVILASLSMAISSGTMMHSLAQNQTRQEIHLDPELERLALGFLQEEEKRREYVRKVDAANHAAEQNLVKPTDLPPADFDFSPRSINFDAGKSKHK